MSSLSWYQQTLMQEHKPRTKTGMLLSPCFPMSVHANAALPPKVCCTRFASHAYLAACHIQFHCGDLHRCTPAHVHCSVYALHTWHCVTTVGMLSFHWLQLPESSAGLCIACVTSTSNHPVHIVLDYILYTVSHAVCCGSVSCAGLDPFAD